MTLAGDPCAQAMPGEIEKHLAGGAARSLQMESSTPQIACAILHSFLHHFADFFLEQVLNVCNFAMIGTELGTRDPAARGTCPSEGEEEVSQSRRNHLNCNGFGLLHRRKLTRMPGCLHMKLHL